VEVANSNVRMKPKPRPTLDVSAQRSIDTEKIESDKWQISYEELTFDEMISAGSSGEIYLGYYYGTAVAIKKFLSLDQEQRDQIQREYMLLRGCSHPNIIQFLGFCNHSTGVYLITEYVEHGDLFDLLIFGDGKELSWKIRMKIALQIAQACYYLHAKNIIHRDLKSQNILMSDNYKVKLCDLGLATIIAAQKRMTMGVGTNEWMAPEIGMNDGYTNKVDVFSFGIVLTELIRCKPPLKREFKKMMKFDEQAFINELPDDCPPSFSKLVLECTKFEPENRPTFKEITALLAELEKAEME